MITPLILLLFSGLFDFTESRAFAPSFHWNARNNIFRNNTGKLCRKPPHIFLNFGTKITFVCPHVILEVAMSPSQQEADRLFENLHMVTKAGFDSCTVDLPSSLLLTCDLGLTMSRLKYERLTFGIFNWNGWSFKPGQTYYFINTSDGKKDGLTNKSGGRCLTHNMKLKVTVCPEHGTCNSCEDMCCEKPPTTKPPTTTRPTTPTTTPTTVTSTLVPTTQLKAQTQPKLLNQKHNVDEKVSTFGSTAVVQTTVATSVKQKGQDTENNAEKQPVIDKPKRQQVIASGKDKEGSTRGSVACVDAYKEPFFILMGIFLFISLGVVVIAIFWRRRRLSNITKKITQEEELKHQLISQPEGAKNVCQPPDYHITYETHKIPTQELSIDRTERQVSSHSTKSTDSTSTTVTLCSGDRLSGVSV